MNRIHWTNKLILTLWLVLIAVTSYGDSYKGAADTRQLIDEEYLAGNITANEKIYYSAVSVLEYNSLPDKFKADAQNVIRSGTPYLNEALADWEILADDQQVSLAAMMFRPTLDSVYYSPLGYFAIHYTFQFPDSVSDEDLNGNEVPDYVERIAEYADSSYLHYHNNLNYIIPPNDGDAYYDIYLLGLGPTYGMTVREDPGPADWNDYSSHIRMNVNYDWVQENDDPEGKATGAAKITVAHEYFHAVQLAYAFKSGRDLWWTEGNATYFEDIVFEEVNDNYGFLPFFFNFPDSFLIDTNSYVVTRDYADFIWSAFFAEHYGFDKIKSVWEYLRYYDLLPSIDSALLPLGKKMADAFAEFTVWNYFTGNRAAVGFYEDGADYPQIDGILQTIVNCPFSGVTPDHPPDGYAANYLINYPNSQEPGLLKLNFDGDNIVKWGFSYIAFSGEEVDIAANCYVTAFGLTDCGIYDFRKYDSIVFIPSVVSQWQDNTPFVFDTEILPIGDCNGDGIVNIKDITYLIYFKYKNGLPPKYHELMGEVNCDSVVNIKDISYLIKYKYRSGPPPCTDPQ
jgi:hypothetical protein